MDNTKTIVDVRTKMECFIDKIEGSINIPLDQVPNHVEEIRAMQPVVIYCCLLYTSPSPRDNTGSRMPSSA